MTAKKKPAKKKKSKKEAATAKLKRLSKKKNEIARVERRTAVFKLAQAGVPNMDIAHQLRMGVATVTSYLAEGLNLLRAEGRGEVELYRTLANSRLENSHRLLANQLKAPELERNKKGDLLPGQKPETVEQTLNRTLRVVDAMGRNSDRISKLNGLNMEAEESRDRRAEAQEMANRILPVLQKWLMMMPEAPRPIIEQMLREVQAALLGEPVQAGTASVVAAGLKPKIGLTAPATGPHNGAATVTDVQVNGNAKNGNKENSHGESGNGKT